MILDNWLRRYRANSPLCAFSAQSWNRVANVLESIEGVGCRIEKTENGWGWQIIVDGNSDSGPPPPGYSSPWDPPFSVSGAEVIVPAFICYHGGTPVAVAAATIEITTDGDWLALQYDPDTESATLILWPASAGLPRDHDGYVVRGIWEFSLRADGAAVKTREGRGSLGGMAEDGL